MGHTLFRVRGELIKRGEAAPIVLVVAERDPHALPSDRELVTAYGLTPMETRIALMTASDLSSRMIAQELGVTVHTVRRHTERVLRKLGVDKRSDILRELLQLGRRISRSRDRGRPRAGERNTGDATVGERSDREASSGRGPRETVVAHITSEYDRRVLVHALRGVTDLRLVERPGDLRAPWSGTVPSAVMVGLSGALEREVEDSLTVLRRRDRAIPVWAYAHVDRSTIVEVARLFASGLASDVITVHDDVASRVRTLLKDSRGQREAAALHGVWDPLVAVEARDIVAACIDASTGASTVREIARRLHLSPRTVRWQALQAGLPPVRRIHILCRLLRVMHRLDEGAQMKAVARELGYGSTHAVEIHVRRHTGILRSGMREGNRFPELADYVAADIMSHRRRHG